MAALAVLMGLSWELMARLSWAERVPPPLGMVSSEDVILVETFKGAFRYGKNTSVKSVPASTMKILTALTAIHHFGLSHRFRTELYLDDERNLKVKGYGDPLLLSEAWQDMAQTVAPKLRFVGDVLVDDSYFARNIFIPGSGSSTNPYDAPIGALCANFNTVFFEQDRSGHIVSAESQTPITPLAREKISHLGVAKGRYTFTHKGHEIARYAGEILQYFLREKGVEGMRQIRLGTVGCGDELLHAYRSIFTLEEAIRKMLAFSNNFMANQMLVSLGAREYGPPGTLEKGVMVMARFAKEELGLGDIRIVEGSGISRKNRMSAQDMLAVLKGFSPYRHLLQRDGHILYKSGTLRGIQARAGYVEGHQGNLSCFVIFIRGSQRNITDVMHAVAKDVAHR
jgi:D-alanyl-D-alanine carboxypeptidase/D-alanyl-D-alanine-endopeptidase (penicillin-binding protein 4)